MVTVYKVTGMTCDGCRQSVEDRLNALSEVRSANVNLENGLAHVDMTGKKPLNYLQDALGGKYRIHEIAEADKDNGNVFESDSPSELRQLFPLFLIFVYLIAAAILLNYKAWDIGSFMLDFMGLFYIVFSFFKFLDYKGFPASFSMYDPLASSIPAYGYCYPFIELALGLLFLMRVEVTLALIVTIVILGTTTIGVIRTLFNKQKIQCACLGTALNLPMTKATLIENSIMLIMALLMLLFNL